MPCPLVILSVATVATAAPSCARTERVALIEPQPPAAQMSAVAPWRAPAPLNLAIRKVRPLSPDAVETPVREEWTSDEGFRFTGAKLGYKRRF